MCIRQGLNKQLLFLCCKAYGLVLLLTRGGLFFCPFAVDWTDSKDQVGGKRKKKGSVKAKESTSDQEKPRD